MTNQERIETLQSIHIQKEDLERQEELLSRPAVTDVSLIKEYFDEFCKYKNTTLDDIDERRVFLFVIIYLFTPRTIAGGMRMRNGVRGELSKVIPQASPCVISNNIANIGFLYRNYKWFREEVLDAIEHIAKVKHIKL